MIQLETQRGNEKRPASASSWALDNLPPFPVVATRLMQMLSKDDVDITEIGRTIAMEPVFATRVLQMANSPLFALQGEVKTISHAIVLLGLKRVKAITITRALGDFVAPVLKVQALRICWQNSLAAAILSEKLARACKMDPDFAYVAGLLRDIGRLALLVKYPEPYANLLAVSDENSFDLLGTERDLFDIDHCQAGVLLMEKLGFPTEFYDVVAHHHDLPRGDAFRMAHLVRIADLLADALGFGVLKSMARPKFEDVVEQLPGSARSRFGQDPEVLTAEVDSRIQAWH
jgi:putative nucleotidyltransferase with HDIG domain